MKELFNKYGIELEDNQISKFQTYYDLLIEWNNVINLTSIIEYEEVIKKHFLDSCLLLKKFSLSYFVGKKIIDIGTGAGFPGIPLAIMMPEVSFTLVDSLNKRIDFLKVVAHALELKNVFIISGRAEDLGKETGYRENFDFCLSRAVASLPLLLEYCSPFVKKEGSLFLYKSKKVIQEIEEAENALNVLNCKVQDNIELANEEDFERYLLKIDKYDNTPEKYPRKAGIPKKKPL